MVAVIGMGVVMDPAKPEVHQVGGYNEQHRHRQDPELVTMPYLLGKQQHNAQHEYSQWPQAMVMLPVPMPECNAPYGHRKDDHYILKKLILYDIIAQDGKAGKEKRQQCTMNSTG
jgi:hypothetical protein